MITPESSKGLIFQNDVEPQMKSEAEQVAHKKKVSQMGTESNTKTTIVGIVVALVTTGITMGLYYLAT